jgi:hypothetical protein
MEEKNREKWLGTLEIIAAKRPDEAEAEWAWLMKELELGPEYFLAIYEAVRQGRWRESENPGAYIKSVAKREARRETPSGERKPRGLRGFQGLEFQAEEVTLGRSRALEMDGERFSSEDTLENLEYRQASGKSVRDPDGVWRTAAGGSHDPEGLLSRPAKSGRRPKLMTEAQGARLARYAEKIRQMRAAAGKDEIGEPWIEKGPEPIQNWPEWARQAGVSDWEQKAIEYKLAGVGRDAALAEQPDEVSRRALQAGWKRLDRSGEARLRENLTADHADLTDLDEAKDG